APAPVGPPPGETQKRNEDEEEQEEERRRAAGNPAAAAAALRAGSDGRAGALVLALRRRDHRVDAGLDAARVVAGPEARQDFLFLDLVRESVRQDAFQSVADLDAHLAVVHEDEQDRAIVLPLLPRLP